MHWTVYNYKCGAVTRLQKKQQQQRQDIDNGQQQSKTAPNVAQKPIPAPASLSTHQKQEVSTTDPPADQQRQQSRIKYVFAPKNNLLAP